MKNALACMLCAQSFVFINFAVPLQASATLNSLLTCEDIGATTVAKQVVIDIGNVSVQSGEPQKFCVLVENEMQSVILASTLLSHNSSLAATAYRTGPKPNIKDTRADRVYCKSLGGTYQFGAKGLSGSWTNDARDNASGLCVFADGSMVSTWTLFYKRAGADERPDFSQHFQNSPIAYPLW